MTSNTFPKNKINKAYPLILPHYEKKNMNSIYSPKKLLLNNVLLVEFSVYYSIMFYILSWRKEKKWITPPPSWSRAPLQYGNNKMDIIRAPIKHHVILWNLKLLKIYFYFLFMNMYIHCVYRSGKNSRTCVFKTY